MGIDWAFAGPIIGVVLTGLFMILSTRNSAQATRDAATINAAATTRAAELVHDTADKSLLEQAIATMRDMVEKQARRLDNYETLLQRANDRINECEMDRMRMREELNRMKLQNDRHFRDLEQATSAQMTDLDNLKRAVDNQATGDDGFQPRSA